MHRKIEELAYILAVESLAMPRIAYQTEALAALLLASAVVHSDFDGDGSSDILWHNTEDGRNIFWFMDGTGRTSAQLIQTISDPWVLRGQADFNGDGTTDLLWRDLSDGRNLIWFFEEGTRTSSALIPSVVDLTWAIAATPDMDGDGNSDILWRLADGRNIIWFMAAGERRDALLLHSIPTNWDLAGTGDFDGDGNDDLMWHNSDDGSNIVWLMDVAGRQQAILIHSSSLLLAGIADFDGNGTDDLLWRDGRNILWFMAAGERFSYSLLASVTDLTWSVAALKDLDGDGMADIHWRTDDGRNILWFMSGDTRVNALLTFSVTDSVWVVAEQLDDTTTASRTYAIVDTNQVACYNSSTGQEAVCSGVGHDGDYMGNDPDYTVGNGGSTITDNVTGLVWQQSSDLSDDGLLNYDDKLSQTDAVSYCDDLDLADRSDWRLPSVKEAYSLILFSGKDASSYQGTDTSTLVPFLSSVFDWSFGDLDSGVDRIIDAQYASTTLYLSTTMNGDPTMFGVNYVDGRIKGYPTHIKIFYVRCVTGNTEYGVNEFTDNLNETVSDDATGLMWQQSDTGSTNWDDAVSQCEAATTGSYDDWRLPNAKELQSILDYSRTPDTHAQAAIDPVFAATSFDNEEGETDWGYYWSSSTHIDNDGDGTNAAYVSFGRALGYMEGNILDVHGAGAQRSDDKVDVSSEPGAQSAEGANGTFYYKGPQGDILRNNNMVRCVRG